MKYKSSAYENPIWNMYECERGNRYTAVKGGGCDNIDLAGCGFSGCQNDHTTRLAGETSDGATASAWFRNINREAVQ